MSFPRRIACAHIPSFPIAVAVRAMAEAGDWAGGDTRASTNAEARGNPEGCPLVLVGGAGRGARILEANGVAREAGIRPGVYTVARARVQAAGLLVLPWDDALIAQAQEDLVARLLGQSPAVTSAAPGRFWLDASGQERRGGDLALGARVLATLQEAGHQNVCVALAASVVAAEAAVAALEAGVLPMQEGAPRLLVVPPDSAPLPGHGPDARFLASLPLALLPLPAGLRDVLDELGLVSVGELASLAAASLEMRFGSAGLLARDLARGLDPRGPLCQGGPRTLGVEVLLDPPAESLEPLIFAARSALVTLLKALAEEGSQIARLQLLIRLDGGKPSLRRDVALARPTSRIVTLTDRCRAALSSLSMMAPARALAVEILERVPGLRGEQGELFEARFRDPEALENAICRIRARCGPGCVVRPVAVDSHCPEGAGRWVSSLPLPGEEVLPLPPPSPDDEIRLARGGPVGLLRRALRIHEPLDVLEVRLHQDQRLAAVRLAGGWHRILEQTPAAHRSGQWWHDEAWARQDCLVTTDSGARLILSRQPDGWRLLAWED